MTHPLPPPALRPLRKQLLLATRPRLRPNRRADLLRSAAKTLGGLESLLVEAELLEIVLLERAHATWPSMPHQLGIMRAYLRYRRLPETVLERRVPTIEDSGAHGRRRAASAEGLEKHAADLAQAALRATMPTASKPLASWSADELHAGATAIRVLYAGCRKGIRGDESEQELHVDFRDYGVPVWRELVREANRRGLPDHQWSVRWHEEAQAQMQLTLKPKRIPALGASDEAIVSPDEAIAVPERGMTHIVCRCPIPQSSDRNEQQELDRHGILGRPLPVKLMPSIGELDAQQGRLLAEFPWAVNAVSHIFCDLIGRASLGLRPLTMPATLLVGPAGSGKSRLARRLGEELNLPRLDLPLGGASDSKVLAGTSRGWAGSKPSDLASLLANRRCASALVTLDEIDKAVNSTANDAGITSYLLALLEPETARRHRDCFLKVDCDYSTVMWIATANRISALPAPLSSRFRMLLVGQPKPEHLPAVVESVIAELAVRWGVDRAALPSADELKLPWRQLKSVRQARHATEAAIGQWAATIQRH